MSKTVPPAFRELEEPECRHYRDQLREARYAALADAEGFDQICFALEALGLRLLGMQGDLGKYEDRIGFYACQSTVLNDLAKSKPSWFKTFQALYETVRNARNDSMHAGAYARHPILMLRHRAIGGGLPGRLQFAPGFLQRLADAGEGGGGVSVVRLPAARCCGGAKGSVASRGWGVVAPGVMRG